jgi:hypothetical protein
VSLGANPGSGGSPVHAELARSFVAGRRPQVPDAVIAAAREERALRALQRRLRWWRRMGRVR